MSNLNPEEDYTSAAHTIPFIVNQSLKLMNTAMPGIVESYDSSTRTAQVTPALFRTFTDGTPPARYPTLEGVPVMFPAFGIYRIEARLEQGDSVLLLFSQRGISDFKENLTYSNPSPDGFFSLEDAIALPGFLPLRTPVVNPPDALVISTEDGNHRVTLSTNGIEMTAYDTFIRIKRSSQVDTADDRDASIIMSASRIRLLTDDYKELGR